MSTPKVPPPPPPKPSNHRGNDSVVSHQHIEEHKANGSTDNPPPARKEQVVMTPKGKTSNSTVILIERKLVEEISERVHVAGGDHKGIIINKDAIKDQKSQVIPAQLSLEFRVFLVSSNTGQHSQESRTLRFWFRDWINDVERQAQVAQDFFRELVTPKEFPRDYVGFIKKIMKQMQRGYDDIQALEVELRILETTSAPPSRPPRPGYLIFCYGDCNRKLHSRLSSSAVSIEDTQFEVIPLTPEKVLELIEQAYPNPITPEDLARDNGWSEEEVQQVLTALQNRGLVKAMEYNSFTRIHHEDKDIKVVKQMPTIASNKQPTIAIITAQYCEKLAVDAMLENKETFVRYTTVGESNVYTLGNIGAHRIVSTKLPSVGSNREAMTATGNTTTRLLGTFQKVDYVFIVGVAGGVPHYTDYRKHVRLGDVVISHPDIKRTSVLENGHSNPWGDDQFVYVYNSRGREVKTYFPVNPCLQEIAKYLQMQHVKKPWENYLKDGLKHLQERTINDFTRPAANTDKLYMNIGNRDVIEVAHPQQKPHDAPEDAIDAGGPLTRVHLGPIGSGSDHIKSDTLRTEFSRTFGLLATDIEMSSVLDSIIGNCRDSFILVKGISDYKDGTTTKKWQNYASLAAAAVMKSIICAMDAPTNV
uniref:DED domain-containing protein n=1 Tax=Nyssomyia neivai TaxID=330878 RepID=A0A1L8DCN3_9DIPT